VENILVTGGLGFIGSNFVYYLLKNYPKARIVVLDSLTYAGNLSNLATALVVHPRRVAVVIGNIGQASKVRATLNTYAIDTVVNFAAESHVDRSILSAQSFISTNIVGASVLIEQSRLHNVDKFLQVSTDEVYGSIRNGAFTEGDPLRPNSPYAVSKAAADMMARAYFVTYGMHTLITRGSNTYGPYQYPEKVIPLAIMHAIDDKPIPVYGDGRQVRDWLYVLDHCRGIDTVLQQGRPGEAYNVGGETERENLDILQNILRIMGKPRELIRFVADRPGHDVRYAVDTTKIRSLGWAPSPDFLGQLETTVLWNMDNENWLREITQRDDYQQYYRQQYGSRMSV
jgi:dTDP-glucose 4,6-dehydratase